MSLVGLLSGPFVYLLAGISVHKCFLNVFIYVQIIGIWFGIAELSGCSRIM